MQGTTTLDAPTSLRPKGMITRARVAVAVCVLLVVILAAVALSTEDGGKASSAKTRGKGTISSLPLGTSKPRNLVVALAEERYARVAWTTHDAAGTIVRFGADPDDLSDTSTGTIDSYKCDSPSCGGPGYHSGYVHVAKIGPLQVNQNVYYQVGSGSNGTSSVQRFFVPAATAPAADDEPVTLALIGDVGQTEHSNLTYHRVAAMKPHAIIDAGDLSYADCVQPRWDTYADMVEHLSQKTPWHSVAGNHEIEGCGNSMGGEFVPYKVRRARAMPFAESGSSDPLYYSFDVAGVHFVMLSSYSDYSKDSAQHAWLRRDLSRVDRVRTPFVVVVMHAPWYQTNSAHKGEGDAMKASMEGVLLEYGVHMVVAGHVHAYERVHAVSSGAVLNQTCGIQYVVVGDGGNREGLYPFPNADAAPEWSAYREAAYGHGCLKVFNSTHAQFQWHRGADAATATPADESWLISKGRDACVTGEVAPQNSRDGGDSRVIHPHSGTYGDGNGGSQLGVVLFGLLGIVGALVGAYAYYLHRNSPSSRSYSKFDNELSTLGDDEGI